MDMISVAQLARDSWRMEDQAGERGCLPILVHRRRPADRECAS